MEVEGEGEDHQVATVTDSGVCGVVVAAAVVVVVVLVSAGVDVGAGAGVCACVDGATTTTTAATTIDAAIVDVVVYSAVRAESTVTPTRLCVEQHSEFKVQDLCIALREKMGQL